MRSLFVLLLLLIACSSSPSVEEFSTIEQNYNGNPPPPLVCKGNEMICYGSCVDISMNNKNCGWCDEECDLQNGEFCMAYHCANVRDFGFSIGPVGPIRYDVRRDLPRPIPIKEDR